MHRNASHPRRPLREAPLRRLATLAAAATVALGAFGTASAAAAGEGEVKFLRNATSSFDSFLTGSTSTQQQWMRDNYDRMRGYPPFFDQALTWAPRSEFYFDLYAIYNSTGDDGLPRLPLLEQHPDWVLKDSAGRRLYIPWACSGGSCTQFAADIGNPEWRSWWINAARDIMGRGYSGIFVDDMNLEMRVGNGNGEFVRPMDPRTGAPMTDANWRRYMAEFAEEIKAAFPSQEVTHNSIWWMSHSDPYVQREVAAADRVELERGFNDQGITGGTGTFSYQNYLAHVDWLHQQGAGVTYEPYNLDAQSRQFELASYLLVSNGNDMIASELQANPNDWWSGWNTNVGDAQGARYGWQGLLRRDFTGGMALVNQPGASSVTVQLPTGSTWTNLSGAQVTEVTLAGRRGVVLLKAPSGEPAPEPTPEPTPDPTVEPTPEPEVTITPSRKKVRSGRSVKLSGTVTDSSATARLAGAATVRIQARKAGGRWRSVKRTTVRDDDYVVRVGLRGRGVRKFRATVNAAGTSRAVRIRVKRRR